MCANCPTLVSTQILLPICCIAKCKKFSAKGHFFKGVGWLVIVVTFMGLKGAKSWDKEGGKGASHKGGAIFCGWELNPVDNMNPENLFAIII